MESTTSNATVNNSNALNVNSVPESTPDLNTPTSLDLNSADFQKTRLVNGLVVHWTSGVGDDQTQNTGTIIVNDKARWLCPVCQSDLAFAKGLKRHIQTIHILVWKEQTALDQ